jgi:hypothetical protein
VFDIVFMSTHNPLFAAVAGGLLAAPFGFIAREGRGRRTRHR